MRFRSAYDLDYVPRSRPAGVSLTKQSFKEETDINRIMERYRMGKPLVDPGAPTRGAPSFGDFGTEFDFHEAQNRVRQAHESFDALPSSLRSRFSNDPGRLLSFLEDPSNRDEAIRLGLVESKPVATPSQVSEGADSTVHPV